jgi:hypothetical protein
VNLDEDLRTMLRRRAEGVYAAPVLPERTIRRVRARRAAWAVGAVAAAIGLVVGWFVFASAPSPDARLGPVQEGQPVPPPPDYLAGTLVASGYDERIPWWLTAWVKDGDLCIGVAHGEGSFGSGCHSSTDGPIKVNALFGGEATVVYGAVRKDIVRVQSAGEEGFESVETIAAPPGLGRYVRFFALFVRSAEEIVGYDDSGDVVAETAADPRNEAPDDPVEEVVVAEGKSQGINWSLSASPSPAGPCYSFVLDYGGGGFCAATPGPGWSGDVVQSVEPLRPEVAPVYGAMPTDIDAVRVVLAGGGEIPAAIFRPSGHDFAYYLAWIPDAFSRGDVEFTDGSDIVASHPLCAQKVPIGQRLSVKYENGFDCSS